MLEEIEAKRAALNQEDIDRENQAIADAQRAQEELIAIEIDRQKIIEREATKRFEAMMRTYPNLPSQPKVTEKSKLVATPLPQRVPKPVRFVKESHASSTVTKPTAVASTSHVSSGKVVASTSKISEKAPENITISDEGITIDEYIKVLDQCDLGIY